LIGAGQGAVYNTQWLGQKMGDKQIHLPEEKKDDKHGKK
jgi:hypothetical protein